jgi:hypothetical protein
MWIPYKGIGVEVFCWVEPEVELLLSVPFPLGIDVCVDNIGLSAQVPQELKINFVVVIPFRG